MRCVRKSYHESAEANCVVTADWGVSFKLSISNGWPGPQPAIQNRITAIAINVIAVFIVQYSFPFPLRLVKKFPKNYLEGLKAIA